MIKELDSIETELVGSWVQQNGSVVADEVSKRIEYLTHIKLKKVASSDDGWDQLYIDTEDSRYWELSHPESDSHGGGAPLLKNLSLGEVKKKYQL